MIVNTIERRILDHVSILSINVKLTISYLRQSKEVLYRHKRTYNSHYLCFGCYYLRKASIKSMLNRESQLLFINSRNYSTFSNIKHLSYDKAAESSEKIHELINNEDRLLKIINPIINPKLNLGSISESKDEDIRLIKSKLLLGITPTIEAFRKVTFNKLIQKEFEILYELIEIILETNIRIEKDFYTEIFEQLLINNLQKEIIKLLTFIKERQPELGYPLSNWVFEKAVSNGNIDLGKKCFKFMFYNEYLRKNSNLDLFLKCINLVDAHLLQYCLSPSQLRYTFSNFSIRNNMEGLLSLVSLTFALEIDLDSTYYLIFLKPLISYSPEIALKLFEHLKTKSNSVLDIKVYTNLIDGILRKSESFEVAYKLIEEIPPQLKTIKVERTISNVLLQAYFRYYDMERCLNFYNNMLESPGTDIYTYSILFQRFSHYKKANVNPTYESNLDMFREDMKKYNIRPNGIIYNMLIKCYLKINYSKALEILDERIACNFKPDGYTYAMFTIYASKVKKDISLTLYWFEKIIEAGMRPIPEVVTAVLNVIKREHDIESAKVVKDLLNRCRYKPSLSDHIDRFVFNVENNIPPINIKKPKKRWLKVNIG